MTITQERLKEVLDYDPETGIFRWLKKISDKNVVGNVAGWEEGKDGYIVISIYGIKYKAHLLAWLYTYGVWPSKFLDHRDTVKSNNRISNLREATKSQNNVNKGLMSNNTSGYKGITFDKYTNRWKCRLSFNGKTYDLGRYDSPKEAAKAYDKASLKYHDEFSLNNECIRNRA